LGDVILWREMGVGIGECTTTFGGRGGERAEVEAAGGDAEEEGAWRNGSTEGLRLQDRSCKERRESVQASSEHSITEERVPLTSLHPVFLHPFFCFCQLPLTLPGSRSTSLDPHSRARNAAAPSPNNRLRVPKLPRSSSSLVALTVTGRGRFCGSLRRPSSSAKLEGKRRAVPSARELRKSCFVE
jgi:hypothetical protein